MKKWTVKSYFKGVLAVLALSSLTITYTAAKTARQYGRDKALFESVLKKDVRRADALLSQGASPESINQSAMISPVRTLTMLAHRTPQNATLCSVLSYAVCEDDIEMARLLLDRGANTNRRDGSGETPLLSYAFSLNDRSETEP